MPSLARAAPQHYSVWKAKLEQRRLFRLVEYVELPHLVALGSAGSLLGEAAAAAGATAAAAAGGEPPVLPLLAKLFVLRKVRGWAGYGRVQQGPTGCWQARHALS